MDVLFGMYFLADVLFGMYFLMDVLFGMYFLMDVLLRMYFLVDVLFSKTVQAASRPAARLAGEVGLGLSEQERKIIKHDCLAYCRTRFSSHGTTTSGGAHSEF